MYKLGSHTFIMWQQALRSFEVNSSWEQAAKCASNASLCQIPKVLKVPYSLYRQSRELSFVFVNYLLRLVYESKV